MKLIDSHSRLASTLIFTLAKIVASRLRVTNRQLQEAHNTIEKLQAEIDS